MARRKPIRYTKKLKEFICTKIETGMCVADIVKKYGPKAMEKPIVPLERTIYRWRREHDEFREAYDIAYQTFIYGKIDEMYTLMDQPIPTVEEITKLSGESNPSPQIISRYISAWQSQQREKIGSLKFVAAKLAPKLIPELSDKMTVEHNVDQQIKVIVPSWQLTADELKEEPKIIEYKGDEKPEENQ